MNNSLKGLEWGSPEFVRIAKQGENGCSELRDALESLISVLMEGDYNLDEYERVNHYD